MLTMIEGEKTVLHIDEKTADTTRDVRLTVNTGKMLFLCAGAFEALYDQVFDRVTSPTSRVQAADRNRHYRRRCRDSRVLHVAPSLPHRRPVRLRHAASVPF